MEHIFISYRREDSADVAGRIYDGLKAHFGAGRVFKDVDKIPFGADFRHHLDAKVGECQAFLVIIGRQWLNASNERGQRRLDDAADFVRVEIESALTRDIAVIPLLVHGTEMPSVEDLPTSIRDLAYRNGVPIRPDPDFHNDIKRLINGLEHQLGIPSDDTDEAAPRLAEVDGAAPSQAQEASGPGGSLPRRLLVMGSLLLPVLIATVWALDRWYREAPEPERPPAERISRSALHPESTPVTTESVGDSPQHTLRLAAGEEQERRAAREAQAAREGEEERRRQAESEARLALEAQQQREKAAALRRRQETLDRQRAAAVELARTAKAQADSKGAAELARRQLEQQGRQAARPGPALEQASSAAARQGAREKVEALAAAHAQAQAQAQARARQQAAAQAQAADEAKARAEREQRARAEARARQEVRLGIFPHETDRPCYYSVGSRMEDAAKQYAETSPLASVGYSYYEAGPAPSGLGQNSKVWRGNAVHKEPAVTEVRAVAQRLSVNVVLMGSYECSDSSHVDDYQYRVEVYLVDIVSGRVYKNRVGLHDTERGISSLLEQMRKDRG